MGHNKIHINTMRSLKLAVLLVCIRRNRTLKLKNLFGKKQGVKAALQDASTMPGEPKPNDPLDKDYGVSRYGKAPYDEKTYWTGTPAEWKGKEQHRFSWRSWKATHAKRKKRPIHFFSALDWKDIAFGAVQSCTTAKLIGDAGQFYVHGMNRTTWFYDGSRCEDCWHIPDLAHEEGQKKEGKKITTRRMNSNPTAWPKLRYWQHSLNHATNYGIEDNDFCVMMDGLDVYPTGNLTLLPEVFKEFYPDGREGILFAGDTVCHPFCTQKGCWSWGGDHIYKMAEGAMKGQEICDESAKLSPGPHKYICGGLYMGRCNLIRNMLNRLDVVIAEDGSRAGYFDQALYQIMQFRYPDLNIKVDSYARLFQNYQGLNFTDLYGIPVDEICGNNWSYADFQKLKLKGMKYAPLLVHFNGDSKVPLMARCLNIHNRIKENYQPVLKWEGVGRHAYWLAPEQQAVVNCIDVLPQAGDVYKKDMTELFTAQQTEYNSKLDKLPRWPPNARGNIGNQYPRSHLSGWFGQPYHN